MDFLWEFYQQGQVARAASKADQARSAVDRMEERMRRLETAIEQVKLVNVAFAELLVQKLGLCEAELLAKIKEVDLRDGVQDGRISAGTTLCPRCHRRYNAQINKCQYCGYSADSGKNIFNERI